MSEVCSEEKSPLLMVDETLRTRKRVSFENSRFRDVSFGVTTVFTHFPNFIGTCWIATAFCGLLFFMMIVLILSAITTNTLRVPRCVNGQELNNRTVHLVHPYDTDTWQPIEFDIISKIIKNYQDFNIHLILINKEPVKRIPKYDRDILNKWELKNKTETTIGNLITDRDKTTSKVGRRMRRKVGDFKINVDLEAKKLLDYLLNGKFTESSQSPKSTKAISTKTTNHITEPSTKIPETSVTTLEELLRKYPEITVESTTFNKIFYNSPLYPYWPDMKEDVRIFAIRVLELWQYGGISFDLRPTIKNNDINSKNSSFNSTPSQIEQIYQTKVMKFIITEKKYFDSLPDNVVAADDEGLHMESKIPCHAFFGEILMNLRKSRNYSSVQDIIKSSVSVFCKHYAAEKRYCDKLEVHK